MPRRKGERQRLGKKRKLRNPNYNNIIQSFFSWVVLSETVLSLRPYFFKDWLWPFRPVLVLLYSYETNLNFRFRINYRCVFMLSTCLFACVLHWCSWQWKMPSLIPFWPFSIIVSARRSMQRTFSLQLIKQSNPMISPTTILYRILLTWFVYRSCLSSNKSSFQQLVLREYHSS
jgi:hypothetical protein